MNGWLGSIDGNWIALATGSSSISCPPRAAGKTGPPEEEMPGETRTARGSDGGTIPPSTSEAPESISKRTPDATGSTEPALPRQVSGSHPSNDTGAPSAATVVNTNVASSGASREVRWIVIESSRTAPSSCIS